MSIYEQTIQKNRDKQLIKESIETLINICNRNHALDIGDEIAQVIQQNHRTLQAFFIRTLLAALKEYGQTENYDLRNESAVMVCREIPDRYIPYI